MTPGGRSWAGMAPNRSTISIAAVAAIGRELSYVEITAEALARQMGQYMLAAVIKMLLDYWSDTVAAPDVPLRTVEEVTGRPVRLPPGPPTTERTSRHERGGSRRRNRSAQHCRA